MKKNIKIILSLVLLSGWIMTSCVKDKYEDPNTPAASKVESGLTPTEGLTVAKLKSLYSSFEILDADGEVRTFPDSADYVFEGTVVSSDEQGNFYKELYVQDSTGGLKLSIDASSLFNDYKVGQTVHVKLSGLNVHYKIGDHETSMIEIGFGQYTDKYGGKKIGRIPASILFQYVKNEGAPKTVTPLDINLISRNNANLGRLVRLSGVEVTDNELGLSYATKDTSENRTLKDCSNRSIYLRNSGYANFTSLQMPCGNGTIVGIYAKYGDDYQLMIRDTTDVQFNNRRCDGSICGAFFSEYFSSLEIEGDINIPNWSSIAVAGSRKWRGDNYNGQSAEVSAHQSGEDINQAWLITPAIDLSSKTHPKFNFVSKLKYYNGDLLKVYVCTDYDGSNPSAANWTELSSANIVDDNDPIESGSNFNFTGSGNIDLSPYISSTVYIGWFYDGSGNDGKTTKYRIDDVKFFE